jgi:mannose-6-phosphate isomerase
MLYPLTFQPLLKEHIWGGRRLEDLYGKPLPSGANVGESWEIADRPEGVSVISNGPLAGKDLHWLMDQQGAELLGAASSLAGRFPLLVKILDCREAPSVQVHPRPDQCERLGGEPKTEVWYVADTQPDAHLLVGLRAGVKRQQFERRIGDGTVQDCLHRVPVSAGDAMFVPSGRVHSIGGGNVVFEIQQNSNTTYRVFDWNRRGPDGQPRPLHIEQSMASIDFDDVEPTLVPTPFAARASGEMRSLVACPHFDVEEWRVPSGHRRSLGTLDRPWVVGVISGQVSIRHSASNTLEVLGPGRFCLIPASAQDVILEAGSSAKYLLAAPGVVPPAKQAGPAPRLAQEAPSPPLPEAIPAWETYGTEPAGHSEPAPRGFFPSRRHLKKAITKRLTYSPFLKILILNFWFRSAVLVLLGAGLLAGVLLPKVWHSNPPGFLPVIKVSLLDKIQARMLRRTAEKATGAGRLDAAVVAWRQALANNRGDARLARGLIEATMKIDSPTQDQMVGGIRTTDWLLRLTKTNMSDLEICVRFFDKTGMHELAHNYLAPLRDRMPPTFEVSYVKALFFVADVDGFNRRWQKLTPAQQAEPETQLLRSAYLAAWGPEDTTIEGRQVLEKAATGARTPETILANRLLLAVCTARADAVGFNQALQRLVDLHEDTAGDHATYWRLLVATGRKEEAARLARDYAFPPRGATDLTRLGQSYAILGLGDIAIKTLDRYAPTLGFTPEVWTVYASILIDSGEWEKLRSIALRIRQIPAFRKPLEALSYYYEGRADLGSGRTNAAARNFERASATPFPDAVQAMATASIVLTNGYPQYARTILDAMPPAAETNRMRVLNLKFEVGMALRDEALLIEASRAANALEPRNATWGQRYAAALLIDAQKPEEALRITRDLCQQFPQSKGALLNHAYALILSYRPDEADQLLNRLDRRSLNSSQINSYYQTLFELNRQRSLYPAAWEALDRIHMTELFPCEQARIKAMCEKMPPRPSASGSAASP